MVLKFVYINTRVEGWIWLVFLAVWLWVWKPVYFNGSSFIGVYQDCISRLSAMDVADITTVSKTSDNENVLQNYLDREIVIRHTSFFSKHIFTSPHIERLSSFTSSVCRVTRQKILLHRWINWIWDLTNSSKPF